MSFIVVQKSEEDEYLSRCDNTCVNGKKCLCVKDIGTKHAGSAMTHHGFKQCVLCERKARTYNILSYNYPIDVVVLNRQVLYDKKHFVRTGVNSIIQFKDFVSTCVDWYNLIFNHEHRRYEDEEWNLALHVTNKCKYEILTNIDKSYTLGMKNVHLNLDQNRLKCSKCFEDVTVIPSTNNMVHYSRCSYTPCSICNTIVPYNDLKPFQTCTECQSKLNKKIEELESTCFICHDKSSTSHQSLIVNCTGNKKRRVLLCRFHSVDTDSSSMDEKKFNRLMNEHIYK